MGGGYQNGVAVTGSSNNITITGLHGDVGTHQDNAVRVFTGSTNIYIHNNNFNGMGELNLVDGTSTIHNNIGYTTENSGTATILSATTSIAVTHGLAVTPSAGDITITPMETLGNANSFWIDTYTSTQFTINTNVAPGADTDFAWKAIVL